MIDARPLSSVDPVALKVTLVPSYTERGTFIARVGSDPSRTRTTTNVLAGFPPKAGTPSWTGELPPPENRDRDVAPSPFPGGGPGTDHWYPPIAPASVGVQPDRGPRSERAADGNASDGRDRIPDGGKQPCSGRRFDPVDDSRFPVRPHHGRHGRVATAVDGMDSDPANGVYRSVCKDLFVSNRASARRRVVPPCRIDGLIRIDGDASEQRPLSIVESETHLGCRQVAARGETPDEWLG